jgi:hypothetical protein
MAAFKHYSGPKLLFHLCLVSSIICAEHGWLSEQHLEFEEIAHKMMKIKVVKPLVDGAWIMRQTGLEKGVKVGRLKDWLWKLQIERSASTLQEMETILKEINWQDTDPKSWPSLEARIK